VACIPELEEARFTFEEGMAVAKSIDGMIRSAFRQYIELFEIMSLIGIPFADQ
jgi:hypothetical protein